MSRESDIAIVEDHEVMTRVGDLLTEDTSALVLLNRLTRLDVNRLFTARCQRQFRLELAGGSIRSHVKDHVGEQQSEQAVPNRIVIGIGVGKHYTLYDAATDHIEFRIAGEPFNAAGRGVG